MFCYESSFWTAASLGDILRRFKNIGKPIQEFPDCLCAAFSFQIDAESPTSCRNSIERRGFVSRFQCQLCQRCYSRPIPPLPSRN